MPLPSHLVSENPLIRWFLLLLGFLMVLLGVIGVIVPGLPTRFFLLMAVWAFSRSSSRFQHWLWFHPRLGKPIQDWYCHRVIPVKAKIMAVSMMLISTLIMAYVSEQGRINAMLLAGVMISIAVYICTRASTPPISQ